MLPAPALNPERRAIEEAALWYARLLPGASDLGEDAATRQAFAQWLVAQPQHRAAWERMQAMGLRLEAVPAGLATPVLGLPRARRRSVVRGLALVATGGGAAWLGWRHRPWQPQYATGTAERRRVALADGGSVQLDARTTLDLDYGPALRRLRLHAGTILVATAPDPQSPPRPLVVDTPQGRVLALGTRFELRSDDRHTTVTVLEHAVRATPAQAPDAAQLVRAGEQLRFDTTQAAPPQPAAPGAGAWTRGLLVVGDRPLAEVLAALARYRRGWLSCDPAVADLRVSGVLPLDDTDQALATLEDGFGLRVLRRWDGWSTRVVPR